jgi:dihydroorotase
MLFRQFTVRDPGNRVTDAKRLLFTNARLINEGSIREGDLLIEGERIAKIAGSITADAAMRVIDADGRFLMPGMIDDQVHFREPGLTHKGDLASESAAAVAGGITSFLDMPNVNPQTVTREALAAKYRLANGRCRG